MREISLFQMNVAKAAMQIKSMQKGSAGQEVYEKFLQSRQAPFRVAAAIHCFFSDTVLKAAEMEEMERYIRMHIRNVTEALIEEDAPERIAVLYEKGWIRLPELNTLIGVARERKKLQSLIYLMTLKNDKYGYQEQEWEL